MVVATNRRADSPRRARNGVPIANAILTTDTEEQARARVAEKGRDAARTAVEMANLLWALDEDGAAAATSEE